MKDNEKQQNDTQTREVVTYDTTNKKDALQWADKMEGLGYTVNISYDESTGIYHCRARK